MPSHVLEGPQNTHERTDETQSGTHVPKIDVLAALLANAAPETLTRIAALLKGGS